MTTSYDVPQYTVRDRPGSTCAWVITDKGRDIIALPFDTPSLVVRAIAAAMQAEADSIVRQS
jgi:hypothetical protein